MLLRLLPLLLLLSCTAAPERVLLTEGCTPTWQDDLQAWELMAGPEGCKVHCAGTRAECN